MNIEFKRLSEIEESEIILLNSDPLVRRQMPLSEDGFDAAACQKWVEEKESQWQKYGYGPWAILCDGSFVGWGGFQSENNEPDLALVLHPNHWGKGKAIYEHIIRWGFEEKGFASITILLPPTRKKVKGILSLGFQPDGDLLQKGKMFNRYRLYTTQR